MRYMRLLLVLTMSVSIAACSASRPSPADIKPVYQVRNSPLPVPAPRWNPRRAHGQPASGTRTATTAPTPRPKPAQVATTRPAPGPQAAAPVSGKTIIVRRGDTLYALSRKHGVPVRALIAANTIAPPYALAVGQKLQLPVALTHTVQKGETGYGISRAYGVNLTALMRENNIRKPYRLAVGQVLKLPGGAQAATQTASAPVASPSRGRTVALPKPPPRSKSGFSWPLEGQLASRFGPKEGGLHNDGINIIARQGTPVRSAEAGVVVYASNALEGYGNLLLLKHAGGWLTAYAHNERLLVNKGDQIEQGQVIARVGATGGVTEPQLHFEIRKGRQALDPLDYLKSRVSAAR